MLRERGRGEGFLRWKRVISLTSTISVLCENRVTIVTLNRPEVHNAFDDRMIAELTETFARVSLDPSVRAILLRGAGKSFCAGADLNWMQRMASYSQEENVADARGLQQMFAAIANCPQATLAVVHGAAIGGGVGLAAVCDITIAAQEATFALSEVRLGLIPAVIAPYVVEKIGIGAARSLFLSGERFGASEALRLGLVQQVTPAEDLESTLQQKLTLLRSAGPASVAAAKRLLKTIAGQTLEEAAETTIECIAALRVSAEGQEGLKAFLEKRKPNWAI